MKNKTSQKVDDMVRMICAGDDLTPVQIQKLKVDCQGVSTAIAGMADDLEGDLKAKFLDVKKQINTMLAGMDDTDKVPAAMRSSYIIEQLAWTLHQAQSLIATVTDSAKASMAQTKTALASIGGEVEKAVKDQIAKGEIFTKADHEKAVNDARLEGQALAEKATKRLNDRRTSLASATLPIPSDAIIAKEDAEFTAAETEAKRRHGLLTPLKANLKDDRFTTLCWDVDKATFEMALELLANAKPIKSINPLAGAAASTTLPNGKLDPKVVGMI